ncbi:NAD(P)-dependent dehydrogenase (short-subunit alcohol dehydrogenase family) [Pedobacter cryoconitis]|uniref:NAD(P)-dependent dehydrogenase (Short-subunit alcohol dehydrogenase family) n=1 Tax=Pedobacter cryoconitis TaxID=188932 RepID=A0A7W8ZMT5_9SPHI|nr:SDR family oxidoreductase [Pedobacter cryoconitis]MBB5636899.1 NAD(P)-dependent dehydrogenase (short-subunit alcohol dehydrogenase family) [Pedobacter cryoconitis]
MESKNKIALVTGGGRGLGKNMAIRLAEKGIDVILTYHSKKEDALAVAAQIEQIGQKAAVLQLDAGEVKSFNRFFDQLKEILNSKFNTDRFDFLINNGGIGRNGLIETITEDTFDELMNVHFKGVYFLTQQAISLLNDGGGIINVSSGLARFSMPGYSAYGAMKGAIEVFTRYMAVELGPRGIRVNSIAPGAIETDFSGGHVRDNEQLNKHISSITALGRVGLPGDIGGVVAFLCTEDAGWITAQRLEVSGGMNV